MQLFHIATRADWESARREGSYTISTHGRALAEEGFIHTAYRNQVASVFRERFREVPEPLVLLTIEAERLTSPWEEETRDGVSYPHIHGPLNTDAVRHVSPLNRRGGSESFTSIFLKEILARVGLAMLVMALMSIGVLLGQRLLDTDWGALIGAGVGLLAGAVLVATLLRARS